MENRNRREKAKRDALKLLEEFLRMGKNKEIEVHTIASAKLNKNLADLIRYVSRKDGLHYVLSSLRCLVSS